MKAFTPADIRELIIPQLRQQADALGLHNLHQAADAMEWLLQFVEWQPTDEKARDGRWYQVWVPREELGTHECIFTAMHVKDFQEGDFWMDVADSEACIDPAPTHYRELPPPPQKKEAGQ